MKTLSRRQQAILEFIGDFLDENDYPPTIRDIQRELGISSTSVVDYNLNVLEQRNLIHRNRNISRGIELVGRAPGRGSMVSIPVIGQIAAGQPIPVPASDSWTQQEFEEDVDVPEEVTSGKENVFALRVKGT